MRQSPFRLASGVAAWSFIGTLFIAAYYDTLGLSLTQIWTIVLAVPLLAELVTWIVATHATPTERFDPRESPVPVAQQPAPVTRQVVPAPAPVAAAPVAAPAVAPSPDFATSLDGGDGRPAAPTMPTLAARGDRARGQLGGGPA